MFEGPTDRVSLRRDAPADVGDEVGFAVGMPAGDGLAALQAQVGDVGFACHRRDDRLMVPLHSMRAELTTSDAGGLNLTITVAAGRHQSENTRRVAAMLLLRASGHLRMAAGYLINVGEQSRAGFIVRLEAGFSAAMLGHALAALEVACRHFAKEVSVLGDERAAMAYLALGSERTTEEGKVTTNDADGYRRE